MRFSPFEALRPSDAAVRREKRSGSPLRMHASVGCMIRPPEQKPGTRVKAHNGSVDAISPTPDLAGRSPLSARTIRPRSVLIYRVGRRRGGSKARPPSQWF